MEKIKRLVILPLILVVIGINSNTAQAEKLGGSYRALLIGNGDYKTATKLLGPAYDLRRMKDVLERSQFKGTSQGVKVSTINNASKAEMLEEIEKTFKNTTRTDISYFYFSGHGLALDGEAYIMGIDRSLNKALFSSRELKEILDKVKGTKVVIIDSCFSGGFIGREARGKKVGSVKNNNEVFNDIFIKTFKEDLEGIRPYSLSGSDYKIITASAEYENSYELFWDPEFDYGGEFSTSFIRGAGYNGEYKADKNRDGTVTLAEMYRYTLSNVEASTVQVYPSNSSFPLVQYKREIEAGDKLIAIVDLNLRSKSNDKAAPVVYVPRGGEVKYFGEVGSDYFKGEYEGKKGYVHRSDLTVSAYYGKGGKLISVSLKEKSNSKTYKALKNGVLRSKDLKRALPTGILERGEEVTHKGTTNRDFFLVEDKNGVQGYIYRGDVTSPSNFDNGGKFVEVNTKDEGVTGKLVSIKDNVLRSKNRSDAGTTAILTRGDVVTYIGTAGNDWFLVKTEDERQGYIYRGQLTSEAFFHRKSD